MIFISILTLAANLLFVLGLFLAFILPCQPGTEDEYYGGLVNFKALWCMGIGISVFLPGYLILYLLGAFDIPETKYKKLEIKVPESIRVDAKFYQDSQEIHRESL